MKDRPEDNAIVHEIPPNKATLWDRMNALLFDSIKKAALLKGKLSY